MSEQAPDTESAPAPSNFDKPSNISGGERDAFVAQLESLSDDQTSEAPHTEPAPAAELAPAPVPEAAPVEPPPEIAAEPTLDDQIEATQREEKQSKLDTERSAFEAERREWIQDFEAKQAEHTQRLADGESREAKIADMAHRAKYDPESLMTELGVSTADGLLQAARTLFNASKAMGPDASPDLKAAHQRTMQQREHSDQLAAQKTELQELRDQIASEKHNAEGRKALGQYADGIFGSVGETSPITRNLLASKGAASARQGIMNVAAHLREQTGELPDASDVIKAYEDSQRADLLDRGIDPDTLGLSAAPKTPTPVADVRTTPASLGNDLGTTTLPRTAPVSRDEQRADVLRSLQSGNLG
jgi:hypothetical protein